MTGILEGVKYWKVRGRLLEDDGECRSAGSGSGEVCRNDKEMIEIMVVL